MKTGLVLASACLCITSFVFAAKSLISALVDPIPHRIEKGDITVVAKEFLRLPQTLDSSEVRSTNDAYARLQYMQPIPDRTGRLVINELRGVLLSMMRRQIHLMRFWIFAMRVSALMIPCILMKLV